MAVLLSSLVVATVWFVGDSIVDPLRTTDVKLLLKLLVLAIWPAASVTCLVLCRSPRHNDSKSVETLTRAPRQALLSNTNKRGKRC